MTLDQSRRAIRALNIAMQELTAVGFDEKSDVCKHLFEAQIAADVCHQLMVCDIMREAETKYPTSSGEAPLPSAFSGERLYTDEEFADLPGDRGFATLRDMLEFNCKVRAGLAHEHASSVVLPHREPRFRVGDLVFCDIFRDRTPREVKSVVWQDNTGFGAHPRA